MKLWPFRRRAAPAAAPAPAPAEEPAAPPPDQRDQRDDGWLDPWAGYNTDRDPRRAAWFAADTLTDEQAAEIVRGSWLGDRLVNKIVDEAFRAGFCIEIGEHDRLRAPSGEERGNDEVDAEQRKRDVKAAWKSLQVLKHVRQCLKWERQEGGAALLLGYEGTAGRPDQPPTPTAKLRWIRAMRKRDLTPASYYTDPYADKFGEVELWQLVPSSRNGATNPAPLILIHESRLRIFGGRRVTDDVLHGQSPGFGDGVLMMAVGAIRRFGAAIDGMELTARRNGEPVWKMDGMVELLANDGEQKMTQLLRVREMARSVLRTNLVDAKDDVTSQAAPLTGYREVFEVLKDELAAIADMPKTVLWGDSPGGIGDTSKGPKRDWYDAVAAWSGEHAVPALEDVTRAIFRSGGEPSDWEIEQAPLWEASRHEEAEIDKLDADTDVALVGALVVSPSDVANRERWRKRYALPETTTPTDLGEVPDDIRDPAAELDAPPDATQAPPADQPVQATAMNGAQFAALLGAAQKVRAGEITRESAIESILVGFPTVTREQASRIVGPEPEDPPPPPPPPTPPPTPTTPPTPPGSPEPQPPSDRARADYDPDPLIDPDRARRRFDVHPRIPMPPPPDPRKD